MRKCNKEAYSLRYLHLEIKRNFIHDSTHVNSTQTESHISKCKNLFLSSLLLRTSSLLLIRSPELLTPILSLLPLLARWLLNLRSKTNTHFSVMGLDTHWSDWIAKVNAGRREARGKACLEFFEIRFRVIDQREPS